MMLMKTVIMVMAIGNYEENGDADGDDVVGDDTEC